MRIAYVITRADAVGGATIHDTLVLSGGRGPVTGQFEAAGVRVHSLVVTLSRKEPR